jgi:very-short-patch-repair endonuclease
MGPERALQRLGGVASSTSLLRLTSRGRLRLAVSRELVRRDGRGSYSLAGVDEALRVAQRLSGVLVQDSAAPFHSRAMKHRPASPCVGVPRSRKVAPERRRCRRLQFLELDPSDVSGLATVPGATVMGCAARMPFDEALADTDSALRHLDVTKEELVRRAESMPDRYRTRCRRVAQHADGRAENPFESVLRAVAIEVPGLHVEPQVWADDVGRPDLLDRRLGLVIEADSFEFHGRRQALRKDCERYNAFVVGGHLVVRFAWEHVMFEPAYVRRVLVAMVDLFSARPLGRALEADALARSA